MNAISMANDHEDITFLAVDDDEVSIMAIKRAVKRLKIVNPVEVAYDGKEALDILRANGTDGVRKRYIVTLDLNMPRMTGLELLEEVRKDKELQKQIIFVLSTSDAPTDITAAYEKNIAGYIVKENAYESMKSALEMLGAYMKIVQLPE